MASDPSAAHEAMVMAHWQHKDQNTARYYAAAIVGIIAVFTIAHWIRVLVNNCSTSSSPVRLIVKHVSRGLDLIFGAVRVSDFAVFPGRILLALLYFGINALLTFYDRPQSVGLTFLAGRLGWMTILNLCLTVFLGLKNTPLWPLTGRTYESLNTLHRCCGYTTIVFVIVHASCYAVGLPRVHARFVLFFPFVEAGYAAGVSMIVILFTANGIVRKRFYEFFYAVHILLIIGILISVGLHLPDLSYKAGYVTIVTSSLWGADLLLRLIRWTFFGVGNYCTLTPLPDGATKVTFHRPLNHSPAGSHAYLWIPAIRLLQRHPFTLVSTQPVQFVIKARNGFTKALYATACKHPDSNFRASVEGPYGAVPDVNKGYDRVLLVAGGSGITFTLALAMDWISKRRTPNDVATLDFVWVVRDGAVFKWFDAELAQLIAEPRVNVRLHVSGSPVANPVPTEPQMIGPLLRADSEKSSMEKDIENDLVASGSSSSESSLSPLTNVSYRGRPDVKMVLANVLEGTTSESKVLIAGCGSPGLLTSLRAAAMKIPVRTGPEIKLCFEEFAL